MAKYVIDESTLTGIANSIRAKKGTSDVIKPEKMPEEIAGIEAGGGGSTPEYPNGMYITNDALPFDVVAFGNTLPYQFGMKSTTTEGLREVNSVEYAEGITNIANYNCYVSYVKRVVFPSTLKSIGSRSFRDCNDLTSVELADGTKSLPYGLETIGSEAFHSCEALTYLELPDSVETIGTKAFSLSSKLVIPKIYAKTIDDNAFQGCTSLVKADLMNATSLKNSAFYNCSNLRVLILRSSTLCAMTRYYVLDGTPLESGNGHIYVPSALIEQYKKATNWTVFADRFRALEDFTDDGTVMGELDHGYCTSVTLDTDSITLTDKTPQKLTATITPKAHYEDEVWSSSNTAVAKVSATGEVTAVSAGECIITVTCGEYSASCNITVAESVSNLLYDWDFTQSLTDKVSGTVATVSGATQDENGLTFNAVRQYCNLGAVMAKSRRIEIDVASMALSGTDVNHRFVLWKSANASEGVLIWSTKNQKWGCYKNDAWKLFTLTDLNLMSGKTVTIDIGANGYAELFADGVSYGSTNADSIGTDTIVYLGNNESASSGGDMSTTVITGLRIYEI